MNTVEYVSIAIAIAVMAARIIMFFPRSGKNNDAATA
jgi:hypothetical protein